MPRRLSKSDMSSVIAEVTPVSRLVTLLITLITYSLRPLGL